MKHIPASKGRFVPASHEDAARPGVLKRVIATCSEIKLGQVMMVNWARLPAGNSFRRHYHEDMQEIFILVQGQARLTVEGTNVDMSVGDTVIVDAREIHEMLNPGDSDAEYIVFGVSSGHGGQTVVVP